MKTHLVDAATKMPVAARNTQSTVCESASAPKYDRCDTDRVADNV